MQNNPGVKLAKQDTQGAVLKELRSKEQKPSDLLENLTHKGYPSLEIKRALSELLNEARVELTSQRVLRTR